MKGNNDGLRRTRTITPADLAYADTADLLNEVFARLDVALFIGIRGEIPIQEKGVFRVGNRLSYRKLGHPNIVRQMLETHLDQILGDRRSDGGQ